MTATSTKPDLGDLINKLARLSYSGDTEGDVLSDAMTSALALIKDPVQLSAIAKEALVGLKDEIAELKEDGYEADIAQLEEFAANDSGKQENIVQIAFDIVSGSVDQQVNITNAEYDEEKIIAGLRDGSLVTTTWHDKVSVPTIDVTATGESIAEVLSQEITAEYNEYR